ncbi:uracil-DNA glycosylase family protein [Patescibacteria group bacterium]|nr:uracil-DNA glycosylase family protein [Patescibacteria group bacterium]
MKDIIQEIINHPSNKHHTQKGHTPIFTAHRESRIVFIGQAPGVESQKTLTSWSDASGQVLLRWVGLTQDEFYSSKKIALVPMDFYFPGKGKSGHLPPRKDFASLWHPKIFSRCPNIKLKILIGWYAQKYYLADLCKDSLTNTVKAYKEYVKMGYFPVPHPSPRNNIWLKKNPWFERDVVPALQKMIKKYLK